MRVAARWSVAVSTLLVCVTAASAQTRSFSRLVTSNGHGVVSFDRSTQRIDTFLEHSYRFFAPRNRPADQCYSADESRDLAHDMYFGVRIDGIGTWLSEYPMTDVGYVPRTSIMRTESRINGLVIETHSFMPFEYEGPGLVMIATARNDSSVAHRVDLAALFNLRLGNANGGREPATAEEQAVYDASSQIIYEYSDASRGTAAYLRLGAAPAHHSVNFGDDSPYHQLRAGRSLDDRSNSGVVDNLAPALASDEILLQPGQSTSLAVASVFALDEDAAPKVADMRAWSGSLTPAQLLAREIDRWTAWHTAPPASLSATEREHWYAANVHLRMGQVREPGAPFGQILASLPPGLGNTEAQWNIAWVRDMAYAVAALSRAGHDREALDAIRFQLRAGPGHRTLEAGGDYRLSATRYFGNGEEETDCNMDGPNVEFDGFGLLLWSVGEYLRAGNDPSSLTDLLGEAQRGVGDVLLRLIDESGLIAADSSIWEVHWNGRQKHFSYTSLAAARGLCDLAAWSERAGQTTQAERYRSAGRTLQQQIVRQLSDPRSAIVQSLEDRIAGDAYVDAAAIEAVNWGILRPDGPAAVATMRAILDNLTVRNGVGIVRNDDGGWYDSQEWVFVDLRLLPALRAQNLTARASGLLQHLHATTEANDFLFSELLDAETGAYLGSIPMIGFGAGAYILSREAPLSAACGQYADAVQMNDAGVPDSGIDAGSEDGGLADASMDAAVSDSASADASSLDSGRVEDAAMRDAALADGALSDASPHAPVSEGGCACGASSPRAASMSLLFLAILLRPRRSRKHFRRLSSLVVLLLACDPTPSPTLDGALLDAGQDAVVVDTSVDSADVSFDSASDAADVDSTVDGGDAGTTWDGLCEANVSLRITNGTPTVAVGGSFNQFSETRHPLVDDGTGLYQTTLRLPPGVYPYKFVVSTGEHWRFDPSHAHRAFYMGLENSALRVEDCTRPVVDVAVAQVSGTAFSFRMNITPPFDGADSTLQATLSHNGTATPVQVSGVDLAGNGLAVGRYVLTVEAVTADGRRSEELTIPFWIEAEHFEWSDAYVYLVMPDRFRNGDRSNDRAGTATASAAYRGGDLAGLREQVESGYFTELGVNTLWVTPWVENPADAEGDGTHSVSGYHGYWPTRAQAVDPRFGTAEDLTALVRAAHARGIRILMDLVVNHVHEDHPWVAEHPDWFVRGCLCGTSGCDWTERRLDCSFRTYMPDIDWTNIEAQEAFLDDAMEWMRRFELDGFRVDAVKHVPDAVVNNLRARVRDEFDHGVTPVFLLGETAMGWDSSSGPDAGANPEQYGTISRYIGENGLDGQFDFVLYYAAALQFLRDAPQRNMPHIDFWTRASFTHYPLDSVMMPYIGSHDTSRFISLASDPGRAGNQWENLPGTPNAESYERTRLALGWLLSLPGAPLLYYGDEYGQAGGADPDNRRMMRFAGDLTSSERVLLSHSQTMGRTRSTQAGLRSRLWETLFLNESTYVYARGQGAELVTVALHKSSNAASVTVPVQSRHYVEGTLLRDALSGETLTVHSGSLALPMAPFSVRYLVRQ